MRIQCKHLYMCVYIHANSPIKVEKGEYETYHLSKYHARPQIQLFIVLLPPGIPEKHQVFLINRTLCSVGRVSPVKIISVYNNSLMFRIKMLPVTALSPKDPRLPRYSLLAP